MNAETEEARPLASGGTEAIGKRVITKVSAADHKSVPVCPTCGMPLVYGHFSQWTQCHYWWCRNEDCEDHMSPVRVPV